MFQKTFTAAAVLVIASLAALPATAGGTFSFSVNATNQREADAIRGGLMLYRIARGVEGGALVHQDGSLNGAAIAQVAGGGSSAIVHQDGSGHAATLDQRSTRQSHGIFQFGKGARANVVQTAHGQSGLTFQFGFD